MVYREDGWVAEVEVVSKEPETQGFGTEGVRTTLKVIKTIQESAYIKREAFPADGEVFSVWRSNSAGMNGGWSLSAG
jgi:hypothetical protein